MKLIQDVLENLKRKNPGEPEFYQAVKEVLESLAPVILLSDSHENYFTRNMIAILAEMRAAFGVTRPSAFCRVALV